MDVNGSLKTIQANQIPLCLPAIKTFLEKDFQVLQVQIKMPSIIYSGVADTTLPKVVTDTLWGIAKSLVMPVNYITNPVWDIE